MFFFTSAGVRKGCVNHLYFDTSCVNPKSFANYFGYCTLGCKIIVSRIIISLPGYLDTEKILKINLPCLPLYDIRGTCQEGFKLVDIGLVNDQRLAITYKRILWTFMHTIMMRIKLFLLKNSRN